MIELQDLRRRFGSMTALDGISLTIAEGEFVALLGPSGCGKSTTLRLIAGLDRPDAGRILFHGRDVTRLTATERNIAMVFQSYALYPHMTVAANIALPLAMRRLSRLQRLPFLDRLLPRARRVQAENAARVRETAAMLDIAELLERKPGQLSGGQKQRAAVARALVRDPAAFLLDEPLSNLDARLRVQMRAELVDLHRRTGKTFVHVTHDQVEAMTMADRIAVMMHGRIVQAGSPREIYERPASTEVAGFVGQHPINLLRLRPDGNRLPPPFDDLVLEGAPPDGDIVIGLRPDDLRPVAGGPLQARLERVEYLGTDMLATVRLDGGDSLQAMLPPDTVAEGRVALGFGIDRVHLFDAASGMRLDTRPAARRPERPGAVAAGALAARGRP